MEPSMDVAAGGGVTTGHGMAERALDLMIAGGPVVFILLAMSVLALAIVFLKLWQFYSGGVFRKDRAREAAALYRAGRRRESFEAVRRSSHPVDRVLAVAIGGRMRGDLPDAVVREEVLRFAADLLERLRAYLRPLEVTASLAPLLGLFGTVLGMISAFQQLEQAGSRVDPGVLSGGIWEALLTTAVGLAVAIPVVAVLNWFERTIDRLAHDMEDAATRIFTPDLSAHPDHGDHDAVTEPAKLRSARIAAAE